MFFMLLWWGIREIKFYSCPYNCPPNICFPLNNLSSPLKANLLKLIQKVRYHKSKRNVQLYFRLDHIFRCGVKPLISLTGSWAWSPLDTFIHFYFLLKYLITNWQIVDLKSNHKIIYVVYYVAHIAVWYS